MVYERPPYYAGLQARMKEQRPVVVSNGGINLVQVEGQDALLIERLAAPLRRALGDRLTYYSVRVERVGRVGEVLVSITGSRGHLPLLLKGEEELEAGHVFRVVTDTVTRFGI